MLLRDESCSRLSPNITLLHRRLLLQYRCRLLRVEWLRIRLLLQCRCRMLLLRDDSRVWWCSFRNTASKRGCLF